MRRGVRAVLAVALLVPAALAAGCGGGGASAPSTTPSRAASAVRTHYPVTVTDCGGHRTTYPRAPRRVVTIDPNITEMLLLLGLRDRIAGFTQFYAPAQEWAPVRAEMDTLKVINRDHGYPSREAVVAQDPDMVASIYTYAFGNPLPTRAQWERQGVATYLAVGDCDVPAAHDLEPLFRDLRNLGAIFDVQDRAEREITALRERVAAEQARARDAGVRPHRIAVADGGTEHPAVYGGSFNAVVELVGSRNVFRDVPLDRVPSWEEFVAADPDVIWVLPDAGPTPAAIERTLEKDPRTRSVAGVRARAYVVIPQADATVESPRLVDGLHELVSALIALEGRTG